MVSRSIVLHTKNALKNAAVQTEVVLMHIGQPWTDFYAKEFLLNRCLDYYNLPRVAKNLIPSSILTNARISSCISEYGKLPSIEKQVNTLSQHLQTSLNTLVPEFGPIKVSEIFKFGQQSMEHQFDDLKKSRSNNFIFLPLYPHFCAAQNGQLLGDIAKHICKTSVPQSQNNLKSRIEENSDYSYNVSTIHRWAEYPILAEYWATKIRSEIGNLDGIVFAVPRKLAYNSDTFNKSVWSTCDRVMSQLLSNTVPYRIAYYNSWDSWNVPIVGESIEKQRKRFGETQTVGIVPITEIFDTFDTIHILPKIVENMNSSTQKTKLIRPDQNAGPRLVQGLAELLKIHLLGRPNRQLQIVDSHFFRNFAEELRIFY